MTGTSINTTRTKIVGATVVLSAMAIVTGVLLYKRSYKTKDNNNDDQAADITAQNSATAHQLRTYDTHVDSLVRHYVEIFYQHNKPDITDAQQVKEMLFDMAIGSVNKMAEYNLTTTATQRKDAVLLRKMLVSKMLNFCIFLDAEKSQNICTPLEQKFNLRRQSAQKYIDDITNPQVIFSVDYVLLGLVHTAYVDSKKSNSYFPQVAYDYIASTLAQHAYAANTHVHIRERSKQQMANTTRKLALNYNMTNAITKACIATSMPQDILQKIALHLQHTAVTNSLTHKDYLVKMFAWMLKDSDINDADNLINQLCQLSQDQSIDDIGQLLEAYANSLDPGHPEEVGRRNDHMAALYSYSLSAALHVDTRRTYTLAVTQVLQDILDLSKEDIDICLAVTIDSEQHNVSAKLTRLLDKAREVEKEIYDMYVKHYELTLTQLIEASGSNPFDKMFTMHNNEFNTEQINKLKETLMATQLKWLDNAHDKDVNIVCELLDTDQHIRYVHSLNTGPESFLNVGIDITEICGITQMAEYFIQLSSERKEQEAQEMQQTQKTEPETPIVELPKNEPTTQAMETDATETQEAPQEESKDEVDA